MYYLSILETSRIIPKMTPLYANLIVYNEQNMNYEYLEHWSATNQVPTLIQIQNR